jgi:RimJ/RimL family protein N-acetyltransferase
MKYLLDEEESERIYFRKIEPEDFDIWVEFFKGPEYYAHWIGDFDAPEIECEKWYQNQFHRYENDLGGMNALIEKESNNLIGHCGLLVQTVDDVLELEIGYSLLPQFWNKGFAIEAAQKCRDFAFERNLSEEIISIISLINIPSQKVALKNGMKISTTTVYKANDVHIFRIAKDHWLDLKSKEQ